MKPQGKDKNKFYKSLFQYKKTLTGDGWQIKKWIVSYPQVALKIFKPAPTRKLEPSEIEAEILFDGNVFNPIRKQRKNAHGQTV